MCDIAPVVVIGAGLQGTSVALELAMRGIDVVLLDQDSVPLNRAALRNEGKIHLGLVYANDLTLRTSALMLAGALSFGRLLSRWVGADAAHVQMSTPFVYAVAADSLVSAQDLRARYEAIEGLYQTRLREDPRASYLGTRPLRLHHPLDPSFVRRHLNPAHVSYAFQTAERALDTATLATVLRSAIARQPRIRFRPGVRVDAIEQCGSSFLVRGTESGRTFALETNQVVNASWESRIAIDQSIGIRPSEGWLYRLKYRVIVRLPRSLHGSPSVTMVLGRYGDVVIRPDSTAYLSWYPVGLQGWSHDLLPPSSWDGPCRGSVDADRGHEIAEATLQRINDWYPGIAASRIESVDAGIIVAHGWSDVDNPGSGLHSRTETGIVSHGGYHSVNPGKLTTAPMFAELLADRVAAHASLL